MKCEYCTQEHKNNNTGCNNSGNRNSGYWNSGDGNSGYWNSGNRNSGYWNSGDGNSGNRNSGDCNSGDRNSGDWNSGDWNSGDGNSGIFNTNEPKMRAFNKECDLTYTEFREKFGYQDIILPICIWIDSADMSDEEKSSVKGWSEMGGYLKTLDYKEAWQVAWGKATEKQKNWYKSFPNFDEIIFEEITGIKLNGEDKKEELLRKADELISKAEEFKKDVVDIMLKEVDEEKK